MSLPWGGAAAICAGVAAIFVAAPLGNGMAFRPPEIRAAHAEAQPQEAAPSPAKPRKTDDAPESPPAAPLLGTLVQLHTDERVPLDRASPTQARFDLLLADRVTGSSRALDPRLLGLIRALAARHANTAGPPRIELVSGYRSPKLNEVLRKKGHHVASHSQHSRGHAVDFRVVPAGQTKGLDPRELEKEVRALGWDGGVGVYTTATDWFVHCDVGPKRNWVN